MAVLMPEGRQSFTNSAGQPLVGGKLYTYAAGTSTPKVTYADASGLSPNTNPIILDARGECAVFWFGAYKVVLTDASDAVIYTQDNIVSGDTSLAGLQQQVDDLQEAFDDTVIWTSGYTTFADAVAAAANRHLMINTPVTVFANTDIAATTSIEVVKAGLITVNPGITLTIRGSFEAGQFQVFTGAGSVVFAQSSRSPSPRIWFGTSGAVYDTRRLLLQNAGEPGGPVHAYEDNSSLNFTYPLAPNVNAYAAFDANTTATGAGDYDHMVGFQSRQTYSGSGSIWSRWDGFNFLGSHTGTGTVAAMRGVHIENPLGTGPITNLYGLLIQRMGRGASNFGIYCATSSNIISVGAGESATWTLRGNGLTGGFGLVLQSAADSSALVRQTVNTTLRLGTNNVDTLICTADGRWKMYGASTVTTDSLSAAQTLEVQGAGGATLKAQGGAGNAALLAWNNATAGDNLQIGFYTEAAPTLRGSIDFNRAGTLTRYNTTSDQTLKKRLGDADAVKAVERLMRVKLHQFAWKDDPEQRSQLGPFAQELHEVMEGAVSVGGEYEEHIPAVTEPRLVTPAVMDGDQVVTPAVWEDFVVREARTEKRYRPWGVDKTAFVWHLVAAVQEQQKRLDDLTARLCALESGQA